MLKLIVFVLAQLQATLVPASFDKTDQENYKKKEKRKKRIQNKIDNKQNRNNLKQNSRLGINASVHGQKWKVQLKICAVLFILKYVKLAKLPEGKEMTLTSISY